MRLALDASEVIANCVLAIEMKQEQFLSSKINEDNIPIKELSIDDEEDGYYNEDSTEEDDDIVDEEIYDEEDSTEEGDIEINYDSSISDSTENEYEITAYNPKIHRKPRQARKIVENESLLIDDDEEDDYDNIETDNLFDEDDEEDNDFGDDNEVDYTPEENNESYEITVYNPKIHKKPRQARKVEQTNEDTEEVFNDTNTSGSLFSDDEEDEDYDSLNPDDDEDNIEYESFSDDDEETVKVEETPPVKQQTTPVKEIKSSQEQIRTPTEIDREKQEVRIIPKGVEYDDGMPVLTFLKRNKDIRLETEVRKYYSQKEIDEAVRRQGVNRKRGKLII